MDIEIQKYSVNQFYISHILSWITSNQIAIPEIQRPFIWSADKVRDLIDSLYKGFPIGYLITWLSPKVELKNGQSSEGKQILIDGQQRIIALSTALLGLEIVDKNFKKRRIIIAFNPKTEEFEVSVSETKKDKSRIDDISTIINNPTNFQFINDYCSKNPDVSPDFLNEKITKLKNILNRQIGVIQLSGDLDIETVTEIFVRINSQGVMLNQADFAMSRMAANEKYDGLNLRKAIDYFSHMAINPNFFYDLKEEHQNFCQTSYFPKIQWLKNEIDDLYDPDYRDVIRVVFTSGFKRGRLRDLVSLLSGRNFETKKFEEKIIEETYKKFKASFFDFVNEYHFKNFLKIIRSAGFIHNQLIRSKMTINFAYALYLLLINKKIKPEIINKVVRRWFVLLILTERYSGSPESKIDEDIKNFHHKNPLDFLNSIETSVVGPDFWESGLIQKLESAIITSPHFNVYLAAQIKQKNEGFLSPQITVENMVITQGDVHHIFPKNYLKKYGFDKKSYNQIANYVFMDKNLNIRIGNKPPKEYMDIILKQIKTKKLVLGEIDDEVDLKRNLKENCIPELIFQADNKNFEEFLHQRRKLMAEKIKKYYQKL
ncbi:MAG: DUF262 domain-containing protein [Patescibacteria group bacterium]|nr:DUF262 domain-containing protein [Patescibacteria group bacterium]